MHAPVRLDSQNKGNPDLSKETRNKSKDSRTHISDIHKEFKKYFISHPETEEGGGEGC
jgi:hypothetical protein